MNLILFETHEVDRPLARDDPRARHILEVLRRGIGETFDAGIVNGPRGKGMVKAIASDAITLGFAWGTSAAPLPPITLIVGLPRPQTARDILRDATSIGVSTLEFVRTEKGDASYAQSTLWSSGEWRRQALVGAVQAFDTRIPDVRYDRALLEVLATLAANSTRFALDNYEARARLGDCTFSPLQPVVLAIGAERGWSDAERHELREHGFILVHLGSRVLRTETAVVAGLSILRSKQGGM